MKTTLTSILDSGQAGPGAAIDIAFCRFLQQVHPDISEAVLAAAFLVSNAYQNGNVCIILQEHASENVFETQEITARYKTPALQQWVRMLRDCPAVGAPGDFCPLILDEANRLYLHKLWHYEQNLAAAILKRAGGDADHVDEELLKDGLQRLFNDDETSPDWQKAAAIAALYNKFTVISGGPGTGKTTTVARLLALLIEQAHSDDRSLTIGLAAPTGKAAARMQASILEARESLNISDAVKAAIPFEAVTIHQLLGARRHTAAFRYSRDNPLPCDVLIVDEASMIDQSLMHHLTEALLNSTKLVLLGDKDQLASVEAGSVMGDICGSVATTSISPEMHTKMKALGVDVPATFVKKDAAPLTDNIILLTKSYRFRQTSGIGRLAKAINSGDAGDALSVLGDSSLQDASLIDVDTYRDFQTVITRQVISRFKEVRGAQTPQQAFAKYSQFQLLAAHRSGPWGVEYINRIIEDVLRKEGLAPPFEQWYAGKPVMITRNDYSLGLSNGDAGICLRDADGTLKVHFKTDDSPRFLRPSRLPAHNTGFALTIHKSQGSEFDEVMIVLPDSRSKVLSRELLYTAVTRARQSLAVIGSPAVLTETIGHTVARNSGLKDKLWSG